MSLESDIAYLYLIDGIRQNEVPPGFSVHSAPRKAARGRDRDMLLIGLYVNGGPKDLLDLVISTYFGAPGSVTSAARTTLQAANAQLFDYNRYPPASGPVTGGICMAILRGEDLYIASLGIGQVLVVHPTAIERFPESTAEPATPFGLERLAEVQYFHTQVAPADYALLTTNLPTGWETNSLTNLPSASLESAIARLTRLAGAEASAMIARFTAEEASPSQVKGRPSIMAASIQSPAFEPATAKVEPASAAVPETAPLNLLEPTEEETAFSTQAQEPQVLEPEPPSKPRASVAGLAGILARVRASTTLGEPETEAETEEAPLVDDEALPPETIPSAEPDAVQIADHVYEFEEANNGSSEYDDQTQAAKPPLMARLRGWARGLVANLPLNRAGAAVKQGSDTLGTSLSGSSNAMLRRVLPEGTLRPDTPMRIPDRMLMAIAILLPIIIAVGVGVVYIQRGRNQQYQDYLDRARLEAGLARTSADQLAAKPHWETALQWLTQADRVYPGQADSVALHREAQAAVDVVDNVQRLNLQELVPAGFGSGAQITQLVVQGTEVYALDSSRQAVYRATLGTDNKYAIDRNFQCQLGVVGSVVIKRIVAITWLDTPNIVGEPALMALDVDGHLMYCKPDGTPPEASTLIEPDSGWKTPKGIQLYADRLYVFDPGSNDIWSYDRVGGVFSERPKSYFTGQVLDLSNATTFTIAQGEIYILRADGRLTYCTRDVATSQTNCIENSLFSDSRPGHASGDHLDDVRGAVGLFYDPPPEPSLYLVDSASSGVYQLSLKLVLQKVFKSGSVLPGPITSVAIGPNKEVYISSGNNVYWSRR
jgi:hypothetical protein